MDSTIQVVGMTTNSNRHPIHNYRTDSHHEERNDYIPRGHRYRTADDVQSRLGINDGWLLRYIPSTTQETIQRYQLQRDSLTNRNDGSVK